MKKTIIQWIVAFITLLQPLTGMAHASQVTGLPGPTWYDFRDESWDYSQDGDWFYENLEINTAEELAQLAWLVNKQGVTFENKIIFLRKDIDLYKEVDGKRVQWVPIGIDDDHAFKGIFIGPVSNGAPDFDYVDTHVIKGMYINQTSPTYTRNYGLFGKCFGNIAFITLENPEVTFTWSAGYWVNIGALCGFIDGRTVQNFVSRRHYAGGMLGNSVYGCTVKNAKITVEGTDYGSFGGIVGLCKGWGIAHSSFSGTLHAKTTIATGGIVGLLEAYTLTNTPTEPAITDCSVRADITCDRNSAAGGIAGTMHGVSAINACAATGTLKGDKGLTGGIVGQMDGGTRVSGCASTMTLSSKGSVGGIAGIITKADEDKGLAKVEHCAYSGHIDGSEADDAGGIIGKIEPTKDERLTGCLFAGTMSMPANKSHCSATVGNNDNPTETVSMSYYDRRLFGGTVVPGSDTHITCSGLTTEQLTSGNVSDVPYLKVDEGDTGFKLNEGYYPTVYCNKQWAGYSIRMYYTSGENWERIFGRDFHDNTNYQSGAWLASVPMTLGRGDTAFELVSSVTAKLKNTEMTLQDGRQMRLVCETLLPKDPCLKVTDKTGVPVALGSCMVTFDAVAETEATSVDRPKPLGGTKQLQLSTAIAKPWDGTVATKLEFGNGTAEDPYIIKTGAQLAYAVEHNKAGEFYEQICDIVLNEKVFNEDGDVLPKLKEWKNKAQWNAYYDGTGHAIIGLSLVANLYEDAPALFGNITETGSVTSLAVLDAHWSGRAGGIAYNMDGRITNCIIQGLCQSRPSVSREKLYDHCHSGGICYAVGPNNSNALVEDCVSAMFNCHFLSDYTPLAGLTATHKGKVRNCLVTVPTAFANYDFSDFYLTINDYSFHEDCYWLKGYEPTATGYTLEEITRKLGSRQLWKVNKGYLPMLKTFADKDYGKLISIPIRTDIDYNADTNFLLGMKQHLTFEPGLASWTCTDSGREFDADGDMGVIAPLRDAFMHGKVLNDPRVRHSASLRYMRGQYGSFAIFIPLMAGNADVKPGITFADPKARQMCLQAFDTNHDNNLSLQELKAVTTEQTLTAFNTWTTTEVKKFPEFRLFKNVTKLTSQLQYFRSLEEVSLPYALTEIGDQAFQSCSNLKEVTMPSKLKAVEPKAFYGSAIDSIFVDAFNEEFTSRDGVLFGVDETLVAYPPGRNQWETTIAGTVTGIAEGAFYKVPKLEKIYFDTTDFRTVPELKKDGIVSYNDKMVDVYVSDATADQTLMNGYRNDPTWQDYVSANKLHCYFPLKIDGSTVVTAPDGQRYYMGTMCIGFDTELPIQLTPYIVEEADREHYKAYLTEMSRQVPATQAVVVFAYFPGLYRLSPTEEQLPQWPLYTNRLVGTNRYGLPLNQGSSAQGSIMTPAYNKTDAKTGFYYDQTKEVPPYHAYLPYNTVGMDAAIVRNAHYDLAYTWQNENKVDVGDFTFLMRRNVLKDERQARLTSYHGQGGNIKVPAEVDGINVTQIGPAAFGDRRGDIWSIDMSELYELGTISTTRNGSTDPLSRVDDRTIVYLPEGVAEPAHNTVVGYECPSVELTMNWDYCPPYDFNTMKVKYDREFSAIKNSDGTWTSKAYTVCLPYPVILAGILPEDAEAKLYYLHSADLKKKVFIFTNNSSDYISAGKPQIIVVEKGSFKLNLEAKDYDDYTYFTDGFEMVAEPQDYHDVYDANGDYNDVVGKWKGTFKTMSNDECAEQNVYIIQNDGNFKRIRNDEEKYRTAYLGNFRSYFIPEKPLSANSYNMIYKYHEEGDGFDEEVFTFPSQLIESDGDMSGYDDEATGVVPVIRTMESDGTSRYFDLQGRQLNNQPSKSVYIHNRKKIIK